MATISSTGRKWVAPPCSTGRWRAARRGGPPAPPRGPKLPWPRSVGVSGLLGGAVNSAERAGVGVAAAPRLVAPAGVAAALLDRSGTRAKRKLPETRKAT